MTNIVLITSGSRPRLLEQTLRTLQANTPADQFNLTIVVDGDKYRFAATVIERCSIVTVQPPCHIIGRLKNLGAWWSERQFGRGEWLCFLDDDMALFQGWMEKMIFLQKNTKVQLMGGVRHPYHGVNGLVGLIGESPEALINGPRIEVTDAVAGYCHLMLWSTWDSMGPYDAHAVGIGQSEDWKICHDIVQLGGKVGYIHPSVMAHCGLTASNGKPAIGSEAIVKVPGILYE